MPAKIEAVIPNGTPFKCHLAESFRTTIYKVPQFFAAPGKTFSGVVLDTDEFRAGITTDPEEYFQRSDLTGQFVADPDNLEWVRECCNVRRGAPGMNLHVVLQERQELASWPATVGQCLKADLGRGDHLWFVDGGELPFPPLDDRSRWRNAVLAAVRIELGATGSFEMVGGQVSFRTTDDQWLDLLRIGVSSAEGSTSSPLTAHELSDKASSIKLLANRLTEILDSGDRDNASLQQLLDALQLDPLKDDAYRRLWFLQLHDRCKRFLRSHGKEIKEEERFNEVTLHRNEIAHEGVERIDLRLMNQLQKSTYFLIQRHIARAE